MCQDELPWVHFNLQGTGCADTTAGHYRPGRVSHKSFSKLQMVMHPINAFSQIISPPVGKAMEDPKAIGEDTNGSSENASLLLCPLASLRETSLASAMPVKTRAPASRKKDVGETLTAARVF